MSRLIRIMVLCLFVLACASTGRAETLNAKVTAVDGDVATLAVDGGRLPNPGDWVSVFGQIPGLDGDVLIGRGKVTEIRHGAVLAKIDARGELKEGLTAQIVSTQRRAATAATGAAGGFEKLFNGRDLAGWQVQSGKVESWRAEGGSLITSGHPVGWLFTEKEYSDFELRLEYKASEKSNSGVCIRGPSPDVAPGANDPSFKGLEIQIVDDDDPAVASAASGSFPTGSIWGVVAPSQRATYAAGEWNAMDIVVRGRQVTVSINGTQVVNANLDDYAAKVQRFPGLLRASGFIGLQSYANQVEFRNIAVKPLSSRVSPNAMSIAPPGGSVGFQEGDGAQVDPQLAKAKVLNGGRGMFMAVTAGSGEAAGNGNDILWIVNKLDNQAAAHNAVAKMADMERKIHLQIHIPNDGSAWKKASFGDAVYDGKGNDKRITIQCGGSVPPLTRWERVLAYRGVFLIDLKFTGSDAKQDFTNDEERIIQKTRDLIDRRFPKN